jgi:tRNA nucleotidyltransferase (CCA-adding enzyme)
MIPQKIKNILEKIESVGFEAFIVGGCVRDLLLKKEPKDWDVTTNAKPEEIQKLFEDSFYENEFGTVGVKNRKESEETEVVEVTTYRIESKYSDKRHPDTVEFAKTLDEDLKRRDFTVNAMAIGINSKSETLNSKQILNPKSQIINEEYILIDLFDGQKDLKNKIIRAVGDAEERFNEDALRMMRAIRFAVVLGFEIEDKTLEAIKKHANLLQIISKERIRDEFVKIINSDEPMRGIELLRETDLLEYIIPELLEGFGVEQNLHHIYSVWEHNLRAVQYTADKKYSFEVRMAALLHDVGKPKSKRGEGRESTFYGHEVIGAKMTAKIMDRLKFSNDQAEKIIKLVRFHLFYYNVGEVTESSVRRLVANIGKENVEDLLKVREADRIGSGTPKAVPYKLRHLKFMIDKVARDPISSKMLKVNGNDVMKFLNLESGPKIGMIMNSLMEEVLDDPLKNTSEYLEARVLELGKMSEEELLELAKKGKLKTAEKEEIEIGEIKNRHHVE